MDHALELPADASREQALATSRGKLECFLVALRYLQLKPVQWWAGATRIEPPESGLTLLQGSASGVVGPRAVHTPPQGWQDAEAAQLSD